MKTLLSGKLRHRITLEQPVRLNDGQGGYSKSWATVASVWARVQPARGAENAPTRQQAMETTYRITLRYRSDITAAMRLQWKGRILNIRTVSDPDGTKSMLEIIAEENVAT